MKIAIILGIVLLIGLAFWMWNKNKKKQAEKGGSAEQGGGSSGRSAQADTPQTSALAEGNPVLSEASSKREHKRFLNFARHRGQSEGRPRMGLFKRRA